MEPDDQPPETRAPRTWVGKLIPWWAVIACGYSFGVLMARVADTQDFWEWLGIMILSITFVLSIVVVLLRFLANILDRLTQLYDEEEDDNA